MNTRTLARDVGLHYFVVMADSAERTVLVHSCALCGAPAALPADGGLQLSVVDKEMHVTFWAVHPACLANVLSPRSRVGFMQRYSHVTGASDTESDA